MSVHPWTIAVLSITILAVPNKRWRRRWGARFLILASSCSYACSLAFSYPDDQDEATAARCVDDTDNDYDGVTDCDDPSCDGYCAEQGSIRCTDGRDNDGDGFTDDLDPRCWNEAERQVVRCSSAEPLVFEERFDASLSTARWLTFGEVDGEPLVQSQYPVSRYTDKNHVFGSRSSPTPAIGAVVSTQIFDGDWSSFELSFSAVLQPNGFVRIALVPAALAPQGEAPTDGVESASVVLTLDARGDPSLILAAQGRELVAPWGYDSWQSVQLSPSGDQLVVVVDGQEVLTTPVDPMVPSRLMIWTESNFWGSGLAAAQLDDLRLAFPGSQPCGAESPQIPFGTTCRRDPNKLKQDIGFTVSVASANDGTHCALLTAASSGEDRPTDVQSWSSTDGEAWKPGASLPSSWGGTLTGAGIAWDDESSRYRAVVGVQQPGRVVLMAGSSTDCSGWDAFEEAATLPATTEAPSYVLPGLVAKHEVYVTQPSSASSGRSLWRLRSDDGGQFTLDAEAVAVFDKTDYVTAPVSLARFGPKDFVAVYPIASNAGVLGLGLLVAEEDDLSRWRVGMPWPILKPDPLHTGFDTDALVAGTLARFEDRALLLYAGRGQPFPSVLMSGSAALTTGTAWLFPPEAATPSGSAIGLPPTCGDQSCEPSERCETCPIDCGPCDGQSVFSETFTTLDEWQIVEPKSAYFADPFYLASPSAWLNLDPYQPAWLTHARPDFAGDFELSFDVHIVAPSIGTAEGCTAYVGVGELPELHAMDPRGVFVRIDQSLSCSQGAPAFSAHVRTGEAKSASSLSVDGATCAGATLGAAEAWHHVALRRENGRASLRVWGRDGCEITSDATDVAYLGPLPGLDHILIGQASTFGNDGWVTSCAGGTAAISVDNVLLQSLPCPEGAATCEDSNRRTACVDTMNSPEHCGSCFNPVGAAEVCEAGKPVCQGTLCTDADTGVEVCSDLLESSVHCGMCGIELTEQEVCRNGMRQAKMVLLPAGYFIDSTEVTRAQYASWLATDPPVEGVHIGCEGWKVSYQPACSWPPGDRGNWPVRCVDWCDGYAYCESVGKHLCSRIGGGKLALADANKAALDQWFSACSSGGLYQFPYGDTYDPEACNTGVYAEVASMPKCQSSETEYAGVYDMSGGASEWLGDCSGNMADVSAKCRMTFSTSAGVEYMDCPTDWSRVHSMTHSTLGFRCCAL